MSAPRRKVVVAGCGFAGYALLRGLARASFDATLVTPRNFFLFTPLLPSAATGTVELRSIVEPARRRLPGVRVVEGEAVGADLAGKLLVGQAALGGFRFELPFDELVIAVGSRPSSFGVPGVAEHAIPFSTIEDARRVRRRVLEQYARAAIPGTPTETARRELTFVVCGGGPTGVEVAAELHDLMVGELAIAFPELVGQARVVLVEASDRLLVSFDGALSGYAARHFRREGIELRMKSPVRALEPGCVRFASGETLEAGFVVWAAGAEPAPLARGLGVELDARGRVVTDAAFRVPGFPGVWALGDCAAVGSPPLPATAQVAQQQGAHLARNLNRLARGAPLRPFRFRSFGMLAYIGGHEALADLPGAKWSGRTAWLFWRSVYLTRLVSTANKVKVLFDWIKARLFGRDLARF